MESLGDEGDDGFEDDASRSKVRVTAKGSDVPPPIEVFNDLLDRYKIAERLLSNLRDNHYKYPTGVQAHGIPILLEVGLSLTHDHSHLPYNFNSIVISLPSPLLEPERHFAIYLQS